MPNSLDLDPEWGAIDLLEEIETSFGIKITNEEAERCAAVGDLYEVVCAHTPDWNDQDGSCGSSMVYYRMRRSLAPHDKRAVTPATPLVACGLQPARLFKKLAGDTGLRLPAYELTWLGVTGGYLLVGGGLTAIIALVTGHWIVSCVAGLIGLSGVSLLRLDRGRFPAGTLTIADLVHRTVPLNVSCLRKAGGRPVDRWSVLVALAAEHGTLPPADIGPDTYLHRRSLEVATAR